MECQLTVLKGRQNLRDIGMTWWTIFSIFTIKKVGRYFWRRLIWLTAQSPGSSRGNTDKKHRFPCNDFLRPYVPFRWLTLLLRIREIQCLKKHHCDRLSDMRLSVVLFGSLSQMASYYTNLGGNPPFIT